MKRQFTIWFLALSACVASGQGGALVIARDGSLAKNEFEEAALKSPTSENLKKLEDAGYIRVSIDNWATLMVDPYAPPLRDLRVENALLSELPLDGKPVAYGSLSSEAKRALERSPNKPFDNGKMVDDTLISMSADAVFWFKGNEGRLRPFSRSLRMPSRAHQQELAKHPTKPLTDQERLQVKSRSKSTQAELVFDYQNRRHSIMQELYRSCTREIDKLVIAELEKRNKTMLAALARLAELGVIPDSSWTKDSIPPEMMESLKRQIDSSWSAMGFGSATEASNWLGGAQLSNAYVSFNLFYSDDFTNQGTPMFNVIEFAQGGR
jgi:hypothetical protein